MGPGCWETGSRETKLHSGHCVCYLTAVLDGPLDYRTYLPSHCTHMLHWSKANHRPSLSVLQPDLPLLALEDALPRTADALAPPAADCDMAAV